MNTAVRHHTIPHDVRNFGDKNELNTSPTGTDLNACKLTIPSKLDKGSSAETNSPTAQFFAAQSEQLAKCQSQKQRTQDETNNTRPKQHETQLPTLRNTSEYILHFAAM